MLSLNDRISIGKEHTGTVSYIGSIHNKQGEWVGITLDRCNGTNNGSVEGRRYFRCMEGYGIFVRKEKLEQAYIGNGGVDRDGKRMDGKDGKGMDEVDGKGYTQGDTQGVSMGYTQGDSMGVSMGDTQGVSTHTAHNTVHNPTHTAHNTVPLTPITHINTHTKDYKKKYHKLKLLTLLSKTKHHQKETTLLNQIATLKAALKNLKKEYKERVKEAVLSIAEDVLSIQENVEDVLRMKGRGDVDVLYDRIVRGVESGSEIRGVLVEYKRLMDEKGVLFEYEDLNIK